MSARAGWLWLLLAAGCALPEPRTIAPGSLAAVASQDDRSCALDTDGIVSCWGLDGSAKVVDPTPVGMPLSFRLLASSGSCAVPDEAEPICWDGVSAASFWNLSGAPPLVSLVVGDFPCGTTADGSIWCWLGGSRTATRITTGATLTGLAVGDFACGLDAGGVARCFGGILPATPVGVQDSITWKQMVPMHGWSCGIRTTDSLVCFTNSPMATFGVLKTISTAPITDGTKFVAIAGAQNRATYLSDGGRAYSKTLAAVNVTPEASGVDWVSITAGRAHTCGQLTSGAFACFGDNSSGQLGDGTTTNRPGAVLIGGGTP